MNPTIRRFRVCIIEDYRIGPGLDCSEINPKQSSNDEKSHGDSSNGLSSDEEKSYGDDWDQIEFSVPDAHCHVFHFKFGEDTRLLKSFETWNDAKIYAQQQYTLVTGEDPFVSNGEYNAAYHSKGARIPVSIETATRDIQDDGEDNIYDYIFIIHGPRYQVYSLSPYTIW